MTIRDVLEYYGADDSQMSTEDALSAIAEIVGREREEVSILEKKCPYCGQDKKLCDDSMMCEGSEIPLCPSVGTWGMGLEKVIDKALEAPIPDGDITTAEEIAKAVRTYLKDKIELCLRYNASDTHIIAKDLLGEI